ncbi:MAG: hypothetical protein RL023_157, partial [Candidatus Parcubacteria bacterium]
TVTGPPPICSPTGATDRNATTIEEEDLRIFPNPSSSGTVFVIATNGAMLFNATGVLISTLTSGKNEITGLPAGMYFVKTSRDTKRLVVMK